jgi:hypothetical protein
MRVVQDDPAQRICPPLPERNRVLGVYDDLLPFQAHRPTLRPSPGPAHQTATSTSTVPTASPNNSNESTRHATRRGHPLRPMTTLRSAAPDRIRATRARALSGVRFADDRLTALPSPLRGSVASGRRPSRSFVPRPRSPATCSSPDGAAIAGRSTWTSFGPSRPNVGRGRAVERKQGKQRPGGHSRVQRPHWP